MPKKVAIIYGWAEGPWESRALRSCLHQSGFKVVTKTQDADILICHSLGCYLLNKNSDLNAQTVILNGIPRWINRSYIRSLILKLRYELQYHHNTSSILWFVNKLSHNSYYIFRHPTRTWQGVMPKNLPKFTTKTKVVFIHNQNDSFSQLEGLRLLSKEKGFGLVQFPGLHDDIWTNPKPYVDLLKKL